MKKLSHINDKGEANMVDITAKKESKREATATGSIILSKMALNEIKKENISKGNVLNTARVAGIMAAKQTSDLIPLCHPIPIESIKIDFDIEEDNINVTAIVSTTNKTGVEMEALMAVNMACLTIYDMIKSIDKHAKINSVKLISKSGGKSGDWKRN
ncbi:MAG: cyclic pyranopterin monophosphate synthase MoaC [Rhodobiaceae bacterium]|nr:cyclic pyranopterin monophosphate synthase MoaC [Rhodobiaceae bacterium]|tara:strand:- start:1372 stop:1842 length:471 start_codon:yes stop_codon:yes gene_type:complete